MQISAAGTPEDWRAASNIAVTLSEYVITVSLSVMAGQAALAVVFIEKRTRLWPYYITSIIAVILLVVSVLHGGWAIADTYRAGFGGQWKNNTAASREFNLQSVLLLGGFLLAAASVILALYVGKPAGAAAKENGGRSKLLARINQRNYLITVAIIFLAIALVHLLRIILSWEVDIRGWVVPKMVSWIACAIAAILAYLGFKYWKGTS